MNRVLCKACWRYDAPMHLWIVTSLVILMLTHRLDVAWLPINFTINELNFIHSGCKQQQKRCINSIYIFIKDIQLYTNSMIAAVYIQRRYILCYWSCFLNKAKLILQKSESFLKVPSLLVLNRIFILLMFGLV